ncbi:MAG: ATP-binding protein, partial [Pseudomonadota bacterium]
LGQLVGGIAHDFNNTLAVLQGNLDLIESADTQLEIDNCLSQISKGVVRGARLTKQLLAYARKSVLTTELTNLNDVIRDVDRMLRRILPETISIETVSGVGLWSTRIDRTQVESAILNIALNARDAMPDGGRITIETSNTRLDDDYVLERGETLAPGRYVLLAITDTGIGMTGEVLESAFDPFYTTKAVGEGTGMGLPMVQGLMRQIEGAAQLYSEPGVGTTLKLYFPATSEAANTATSRPEVARQGDEHILVVEDDDGVRDIICRQLSRLGYRVTQASDGDQALAFLSSNDDVELLVTDIVMPGHVQGPELATRLRALRPGLPVIFMSGYPREASIHGNGLQPDDINLMKPVKASALAKAVRSALDNAESR